MVNKNHRLLFIGSKHLVIGASILVVGTYLPIDMDVSTNQYQLYSHMVSADSTNKVVTRENFLDYYSQVGSAQGNYDPTTGVQKLTTGSSQSGNVFFTGGMDLREDVVFKGAVNLGNATPSQGVADGIGFVMHQELDIKL